MREGGYHEYLQSLGKKELVRLLYKAKKSSKPFPAASQRTVALRLSYDGRAYSGVQHHAFIRSIEDEVSTSLSITGIGSDLVFCGRTDAGVSAINMVVSIRAKSRLQSPNRWYDLAETDSQEYPYDKIINERLPEDIRVTGWAPVPDDFHARHSCIQRSYKYYFVLKDMDLARINDAADRIRKMTNFYRLSTHSNPRAVYDRKIDELTIVREEGSDPLRDALGLGDGAQDASAARGYHDLYCLNIRAGSFLHNMVRKIAWVIKSCGKGNAFDLDTVRIAKAHPLVFSGAKYRHGLNFIGNRFSLPHFQRQEEEARILHRISRLRLSGFDK